MNKKSVYIVTLGCSKNEVDSEIMLGILDKDKYCIADSLEDANIIIVNTCGFIESAKEESIDEIWEMTKYKRIGDCEYLLLSGCLAQRYSKELLDEIEDVDAIIGTGNIKDLNNILDNLKSENRLIKIDNINSQYLEGVKRINHSSTAYVRISEGCDNFCTYCIIPKLRGKHRSRRIEDIIHEVEEISYNGVKEIVLIAQNTTDYGKDLYGQYSLALLLNKLNIIKDVKWIRILYLYPDNINDELISAIKNNDKVVKYLDIPLQHINDNILKLMNRKTNRNQIIQIINKLRREIPEIIIRTTFIVGFPGEIEDYFNDLYEFIEEMKFDKLGVFTYSKEEGTSAYGLANQLDDYIKEDRKNKIMKLQKEISKEKLMSKVNKTYETLVEEKIDDRTYIGRTYMDNKEIDGLVYISTNKKLSLDKFYHIRITDSLEYDLIGVIEDESSK